MKRNLLCMLLIIVAVSYTTAQEIDKTELIQEGDTTSLTTKDDIDVSTQCEITPVSPWSIGIKIGNNYFRVSPLPVSRLDQIHLMGGATVEYSFSPLVGVGLEYNNNPYGRRYYLDDTETTTGTITGGTQDFVLYGSINLSNLLFPYRKNFGRKLNIFGDAGVGYGFYKNSLDANPDGIYASPMANIGINAEFNFSKLLALCFEGQYRSYHRKLVSGTSPEKSNALTTTIGLRYKLDANGSRQHARNISMCEYYPKPDPVIIEKIVKDNTDETEGRLKAVEAENAALNDKIQKLSDAIIALSSKDQGTIDAFFQNKGLKPVNDLFQNIEFEFDSDKLRVSSYSILDKVVAFLKNNSGSVRLSVVGYTDYVGTEEFNQMLSINRANAVRVYLLAKGISASRISISGYGEEKPISTNRTKDGRQRNRRVEFQIEK